MNGGPRGCCGRVGGWGLECKMKVANLQIQQVKPPNYPLVGGAGRGTIIYHIIACGIGIGMPNGRHKQLAPPSCPPNPSLPGDEPNV